MTKEKKETFNNGKDIMLEDIYHEDGLYYLTIGHPKTKLKFYVSGSRWDLIEILIDHLKRIKRVHELELYKEVSQKGIFSK